MGQRLTVIVKRNTEVEEPLAVIYYHWSAYSIATFEELEKLSRFISAKIDLNNLEKLSNKDIQLKLIKIVETNGGGVDLSGDGEELKYVTDRYPNEEFKKDDISRNNGLICISDAGMEKLLYYSEGIATIFLDERAVNSEVWLDYTDYNEYEQNTQEEYLIPKDNFEKVNFAFTDNIKFDELSNVLTQLQLLKSHCILDANNTIIQLY